MLQKLERKLLEVVHKLKDLFGLSLLESWLFDRACKKEFGYVLTGEFKHFCYEWDFLAIDENDPEFDACWCYK